jgi:hypothetical protein
VGIHLSRTTGYPILANGSVLCRQPMVTAAAALQHNARRHPLLVYGRVRDDGECASSLTQSAFQKMTLISENFETKLDAGRGIEQKINWLWDEY